MNWWQLTILCLIAGLVVGWNGHQSARFAEKKGVLPYLIALVVYFILFWIILGTMLIIKWML